MKNFMNKKIIIAFALPLMFTGCYRDEGNYDYHDINQIEVDGIDDNYSVDVDDSLIIKPTLKGTLYSDTARFTYSWEIGPQEIAKTHDLHMQMNLTPGFKYSRFIITDKETNVKTYKVFGVNVSSSTAGDLIVVLSKYQGRAEMSYLRLDKPANRAVNYFQSRTGQMLGKNPQQLCVLYSYSGSRQDNMPFVNRYGRVIALVDNVGHLIDKTTMMPDTVAQTLTQDAYLGLVSYPKPDISGYKSEFFSEGIALWRQNVYGTQMYGDFMEISNGHIFGVASMAPSIWTHSFFYDIASPYANGYLSPFGYWNDMTDTPNQAGYSLGRFVVFDRVNGRFASCSDYGSMRPIAEENIRAFPGYTMIWGSATNRPNTTSIAVLSDGTSCRLVLLEGVAGIAAEIGGGSVVKPTSKFYMMKYNDNLFFSSGNAIYRYNIMDIGSGMQPSDRNKIVDLTQLGYDGNAKITDICVSRTEKTMLVGVSRYGDDAEAMGDEPKGDLLYFDIDSGSGTLTYNAEKSHKGISGIPVDVEIKYQTHYRNGLDLSGNLKDNI